MIEYGDLIGKPFAYGARGPEVFDCWGLAMEGARRAGLELPDYPSVEHPAARAHAMLQAIQTGWEKLPGPQANCVVWLRMDRKTGTHVGWMLDEDHFIHTTEETAGVARARISHPLWLLRVAGYYRRTE